MLKGHFDQCCDLLFDKAHLENPSGYGYVMPHLCVYQVLTRIGHIFRRNFLEADKNRQLDFPSKQFKYMEGAGV